MQIKTTLRLHLTPANWQSSRKQTATKAGEKVGKKKPSYTADGNVNKCNHSEKKFGSFLKI
jgi:hypothetical protein